MLTVLLIGGGMYVLVAGAGLLWWGKGFVGAMEGRHAPERVRAARTVHIYDTVIDVEADRVVFRQSLWKPWRRSVLAAIGTALVIAVGFALKRRSGARRWMWVALLVAAVMFARSYDRSVVTVRRGTTAPVTIRAYGIERGGPSTRTRYEGETGYDVLLAGGATTVRLVRLPWNSQSDAENWRGLIEEKLRP